MRIIYAGTPEIAVPSLKHLAATEDIDVVAVLTAADKSSGRGRKTTPPPVKAAAETLGIPVLQPERLGADARDMISGFEASLLVVFAYGRIFGPKFLSLFPEGAINMHPSALPRHRGPAPLTAAILAGEKEMALTVQKVALDMDAGDILSQTPYPLDGRETTGSLTDTVAKAAADELIQAVRSVGDGSAVARPQNHENASYCHLVRKDDGIVDWSNEASALERMIRAYLPWPKVRTFYNKEPLVILEADDYDESPEGFPGQVLGVDKSRGILIQTGKGVLGITRLQLASRKPLDFKSFLNGVTLETGTILGDVHES